MKFIKDWFVIIYHILQNERSISFSKFYVVYDAGGKTHNMSYEYCRSYACIFGGTVYHSPSGRIVRHLPKGD